jgi:hypothetical protein
VFIAVSLFRIMVHRFSLMVSYGLCRAVRGVRPAHSLLYSRLFHGSTQHVVSLEAFS